MVETQLIIGILVALVIAAIGFKILKSIVKGTIIGILALIVLYIAVQFGFIG